MADVKRVLVSGIQPSGRLHLGNYFGAMKRFVELQEYEQSGTELYIFIANYHALTSQPTQKDLMENTKNAILDHLAVGLKAENLYLQSDVPEVAELAWIFNNLITVPYLSRAVAYKDKVEKGLEATVGLFDYPVLMAADILIMGADVVPVGEDQKQHVEIARDIAEKFNNFYGPTFKQPTVNTHLALNVAVPNNIIPGIDGKKMSKSHGNSIPLFATDEEIKKLVMSIVTDSKGETEPKEPSTDTVFALHRLFMSGGGLHDLEKRYRDGTVGYRESKEMLIKNIITFVTPLRARRKDIEAEGKNISDLIERGRERAQKRAREKMNDVRSKVGLFSH